LAILGSQGGKSFVFLAEKGGRGKDHRQGGGSLTFRRRSRQGRFVGGERGGGKGERRRLHGRKTGVFCLGKKKKVRTDFQGRKKVVGGGSWGRNSEGRKKKRQLRCGEGAGEKEKTVIDS